MTTPATSAAPTPADERLTLVLNGDVVALHVAPHQTLLETLRVRLGLTGTKEGCGKGECGCCTVLVNGTPRLSCITLAADVDGARVDTVEGLAKGGRLHMLQEAFVRHGAAQCGFCTPGMLMSAVALLEKPDVPTRQEVAHALSGNLCRCTGYIKILDAVVDAAQRLHGAAHG